jgi:hypothetical protein
MPPSPVISKNSGPKIRFQDTAHWKPILINAEDFRAVREGFQHSVFCCFGYECIYSRVTMLSP